MPLTKNSNSISASWALSTAPLRIRIAFRAPMLASIRSNINVRALVAVYSSTFLSSAWTMIIPTIPVLAKHFGVSAGGAAQLITAFAIGKFVGTIIAGIVLDRMGTRIGLVGGPLVGSLAALSAAG